MSVDLNRVLTTEEGQYFERKNACIAPKDILKELVAFANASGGTLVIGIENDGTVTGFGKAGAKRPEDYLEAIQTLLRKPPLPFSHHLPEVINAAGQPDVILVLEVEVVSSYVVENHDGDAYLRVNDKSIKLNYEQRRKLEYDKGQRFYEDEEVLDSSIADVDMDVIRQFQERMGTSHSTAEQVLTSRKLMRNGRLTHAGLLLFGKDPSLFLPGARLRFLRYEGTAMKPGQAFNVVKEVTITGAIPKMIAKAKEVVSMQLREFQYLDTATGQFQPMPEYPEFAWFEGIVNALTHRDYTLQGDHVRVSMFDDHLEIFSPGKLPSMVSLSNMKENRFSRNPKISRTLTDFGWVKELNEGVRRIYSVMEASFLSEPVYSEPGGHAVLLVLKNNILNRHLRAEDRVREAIDERVMRSLSEAEKMVLQYTYMKGRVTTKETALLTNKSVRFASSLLKKLAAQELLCWHGTHPNDATQYYTFCAESVQKSQLHQLGMQNASESFGVTSE